MGKMHVLLSAVQYARSIKYQNKILKKTQVNNPSNIPVYTYICICTRALTSRASSTKKTGFFSNVLHYIHVDTNLAKSFKPKYTEKFYLF